MGLPSPASLTLSEAVAFVTERCNCSEDEAKDALRRAGRDSQLESDGDIPLSAHPDPAVRDVIQREGENGSELRIGAAILIGPPGLSAAISQFRSNDQALRLGLIQERNRRPCQPLKVGRLPKNALKDL
jgi:hypothetical protein